MAEENVVTQQTESAPAEQPPRLGGTSATVTPAETAPQGDGQKTAASAPADKSPEGDKKTDDQPEKQSSRRFERRIEKAHRLQAEAKARADFFEGELNKVRQTQQQARPHPGAPRLEDYPDIEQYANAKAQFETNRVMQEAQQRAQNAHNTAQIKAVTESWETKAEKGAAKFDDFDEKVGELKPTNAVTLAIMEADNGDDIAYYLATHMDEAKAIGAMSQVAQIRAIGRLEAKLLAEPLTGKTKSDAPAPIKPLNAGAQVNTAPSQTDDMATWMKKRQKEVHGRQAR